MSATTTPPKLSVRHDAATAVAVATLHAGKTLPVAPTTGAPTLADTPGSALPRVIKRGFDLAAALIGLVMLLPLLFLLGAVVAVTSPGPVLYRQERVGRGGRPFRIVKLRTMRPGADALLVNLLAEQSRAGTPLFKVDDDPRVTPVGRFLRRYSLDELPQLWNVVRGDMSLVGPRPQRPAEVALYAPHERDRLAVRPGMTGLWQVSGRSDLPWPVAVSYDLEYVHRWSLRLDANILLRTWRVVVTGAGAA